VQPSQGLGIAMSDAPGGGARVERVEPGSPADGELRPGDVIVEANHGSVDSAEELSKRAQSLHAGQAVLLKVKRNGHTIWVGLQKH